MSGFYAGDPMVILRAPDAVPATTGGGEYAYTVIPIDIPCIFSHHDYSMIYDKLLKLRVACLNQPCLRFSTSIAKYINFRIIYT
jgi:hypothetical protein